MNEMKEANHKMLSQHKSYKRQIQSLTEVVMFPPYDVVHAQVFFVGNRAF